MPQIKEEIAEMIQQVPQERKHARITEHLGDLPVPHNMEDTVKVKVMEQFVAMPVPQIMEDTVQVTEQSVDPPTVAMKLTITGTRATKVVQATPPMNRATVAMQTTMPVNTARWTVTRRR